MSSLCDNCATVGCIFQAGIERERCAFYKNKNDVIKRQDAIDAIMREPTDAHYPSWYADRIKALPSTEAKPIGEWIYHIDDLFPFESTQECSNCNKHQPIIINDDNFCPSCGAVMKQNL